MVLVVAGSDFVAYVLGVGVSSVAYLSLRGHLIDLSLPRRSPTAIACLVAPATGVLIAISAGEIVGVSVASAVNPIRYVPNIPLTYVLFGILAPAGFFGVGYALLVCGVIHESIRRRVVAVDRHAVALTAAVGVRPRRHTRNRL